MISKDDILPANIRANRQIRGNWINQSETEDIIKSLHTK